MGVEPKGRKFSGAIEDEGISHSHKQVTNDQPPDTLRNKKPDYASNNNHNAIDGNLNGAINTPILRE